MSKRSETLKQKIEQVVYFVDLASTKRKEKIDTKDWKKLIHNYMITV